MAYETLLLEVNGPIATLTVNRPKALNALNAQTFDELSLAFDEVAAHDAVRVLVITGAGEKAFVAGADITEFSGLTTAAAGEGLAAKGQAIFRKLEKMGKPVIAAVNGFALGGGLELALACDFRIAADTARIGLPEITLGILPGYGGTQRLARLIGKGRAKKLVFTGGMVDAAEAFRQGIVEEVVPAAELMERVGKFAAKLAAQAPIALAEAKRAINEGMETDLDAGSALEAAAFGRLCETEDMKEGAAAFLAKRPALFKGR